MSSAKTTRASNEVPPSETAISETEISVEFRASPGRQPAEVAAPNHRAVGRVKPFVSLCVLEIGRGIHEVSLKMIGK